MRHSLIALLGLTLIATKPAAAQSEVSDGPAVTQGPWAAEFIGVLRSFNGGSLLRYSTPTAAWRLSATVDARDTGSDDNPSRGHRVDLEIGRRWHATREGRVQPFTGAGVSGLHQWTRNGTGSGSTSEAVALGAYWELGAQIFVADEIALGSRWTVDLNYENFTSGGAEATRLRLIGGGIDVFSMIRF